MRKTVLLFLFAGFATIVNAQFLKVGAKLGANMVKMEGHSFKDGFQLGYLAGAFVELKAGKKFYLQPELLFAETNLRTTSSFHDIYKNLLKPDIVTKIKLQAISIPILLNYKIANILSVGVGPQFTINRQEGESIFTNAKDAFGKGDVALVLGANVMISKLRVSGRYMAGSSNVNNIDNQDKWKQQTMQLAVGFVF